MRNAPTRWLAAALLLALSACGDLPRPFQGDPGIDAVRLARPPTARLAVPTPPQALLGNDGAERFAEIVADELEKIEVPAVARTPRSGDWKLAITAELTGGSVVPTYTVLNPQGASQGTVQGAPVPAAAWAAADTPTLRQAGSSVAHDLSSLLTRIEAARKASDPAAMRARASPPKVALVAVKGAPGDGNAQLARQMREFLTQRGLVVQDGARGADWLLEGRVEVARGASAGTQRVEIQWILANVYGEEYGRIVQMNEVPAGSLDRAWGDVAFVVADEASGGVKDVIDRQPR